MVNTLGLTGVQVTVTVEVAFAATATPVAEPDTTGEVVEVFELYTETITV
jgi:hypothetical protein